MVEKTVSEIAKVIGGIVIGNGDEIINKLAGIKDANKGDLTLLTSGKYLHFLEQTKASAILLDDTIECKTDKTLIKVKNASNAFNIIINTFFYSEDSFQTGVDKFSSIGKNVKLGKDVCIQPFVTIEDNVEIGDNSIIQSGVFIGRNSKIGKKCWIHPNVSILKDTIIGMNVIIHSGTVLGSDGFGFEPGEGIPKKYLQVGIVIIEDDVEIGANVAIDRARFDKTIIRKGTKIDNLVHIAHNVDVGENCLILAQVAIAGSTVLKQGVILAGQSGVAGHLTIGDRVIVTSKAGVTKNIKEKEMVSGFPACDHRKFKRISAGISRLPELIKKILELEKQISELKEKK